MATSRKGASPHRLEQFCDLARQLGARDAKVISPKNVFTGEWVRWKCQYGCSEYGRHLTCPPHSPTPAVTRKVLDEYQYAILLHGERTAPLRDIGAELELRIFLAGYYKAFALLCGPCSACGTCAVLEEHAVDDTDYKVRRGKPQGAPPGGGWAGGWPRGEGARKASAPLLARLRCRHPEKARPAMEAAGIDVFATARAAGFPIEVIFSATCKQNYYALVLVE